MPDEHPLNEEQKKELLEVVRGLHCQSTECELEVNDVEELSVADHHVWVKGWFYVSAADLSKELQEALGITDPDEEE